MTKPNAVRFSNPNVARLGFHIQTSAMRDLPFVRKGMHADAPGAVICGLSPNLKDRTSVEAIRRYAQKGWLVFGIKEGIGFLKEQGIPVHYSVNMDPGAQEAPRMPLFRDVTYCLASSCHPDLFDRIQSAGCPILVYHSACGWPNEVETYRQHHRIGDTVIGGFTVANRALGLANYMGIRPDRIALAGAMFGFREGGSYYADVVAAQPYNDVWMKDDGKVDGRVWVTRPDLLASAVAVARLIKAGQCKIIGESLARSLAKHPDEFLDRVAAIKKADGTFDRL